MTIGIGPDLMSKEDLHDLEETLTDLAEHLDMTAFELGFVEDMISRVEHYGDRVIVTERQQEVLDKMKAKYLDDNGTAALPFDTD